MVVDARARFATVTAGARVFALLVLAAPVAVTADYDTILNLVILSAVWTGFTFVDVSQRLPVMPSLVVESSLVTFVAALELAESAVLLPAIVIPQFIGGLVRGTRGALEVLGAEVVILAAATFPSGKVTVTGELVNVAFTWLMVGLGFGLIAALVHRLRALTVSTSSSYRDARALITQLLDLSGDLVDGLDPVSISQNIVALAKREIPIVGAVVYALSPDGHIPLTEGAESEATGRRHTPLITAVTVSQAPAKSGSEVAIPLHTDAGIVGVLVGTVPAGSYPGRELEADLHTLSRLLRHEALQLDTALLFSTVRNEATSEERRRLAREMHDGVAQDLAALGYRIDDLAAEAESELMAQRAHQLREELSHVVAELRRSVFSLRNENPDSTLGTSLRSLAAHIESRSGMPVLVEVDEGDSRLRPEVETELLRIAQEGMNNAVRHAKASKLLVSCWVRAPAAEIAVVDDGRGLQSARDDSHGIRIMRERATRIGASLELTSPARHGGTQLLVTLGTSTQGTRDKSEEVVTS